jgi:hypothetical protein
MDAASGARDCDSALRLRGVKTVGRFRRLLMHLGLAQHQPDAVRLATDVESLRAWVNAHKGVGPSENCLVYRALEGAATDVDSLRAWVKENAGPGENCLAHLAHLAPAGAATDIESLRARVNAHKGAGPGAELRFQICLDYLTRAGDAANVHDVASGYEYLHIADREAVFLMTRMERKVRALSLRVEARSNDKFGNSWRVRAILRLLEAGGTDDSSGTMSAEPDADVLPEALAEAVAHRNTLDRNGHRKTDKMRWQLAWLGLIVLVLVLTAFVFVIVAPLPSDLKSINLMPHGIYLGLLGGFVSSAITQRTADRKARVPEIEVSFYAALARGTLGAATSIPVYILVKAGLISVGGAADSSVTWGLLLLCFLTGFSERWFLTAVTSVARDDKKEDKPRVGFH